MATKRYDAAAACGKYTDKNGETRQRWHSCGAVFENEKGLSLKLESLPVGIPEGGLWISFFEPKDQQRSQQKAPSKAASASDDFDDSIPY